MTYSTASGLGVRNHYGPRAIDEKFGGETTTSGNSKECEWIFTYDDLPTYGTGEMEVLIPANAFIKEARIEVLEAMTGTTGTLTLGFHEQDGTAIDADGIDAAVAQATLVANAWVVCDGALVGASIGSAAGQLVATTGGTVTGGKFRVIVEYEDPADDASGRYTAGGTKA